MGSRPGVRTLGRVPTPPGPSRTDLPPLPVPRAAETAEVQRSVRHLRDRMAQIEGAVSDRSFRLWTLLTLNVLDLLTTAAVLTLGGVESNPAMVPVVERWWAPIVVKLAVVGVMWAVALRTPVRSRVGAVALVAAWVFYAGVVGWNTIVLAHLAAP